MNDSNIKTIDRHFRSDKETDEVLARKSQTFGLTKSEFIRYAIHRIGPPRQDAADAGIKTIRPDDAHVGLMKELVDTVKGLLTELRHIGNNLNQAVHSMNTSMLDGGSFVTVRDINAVLDCAGRLKEWSQGLVQIGRWVKQNISRL